MGCKDTVLPEPLLKNQNVNCPTYEQNTKKPYKDNLCLLRALALHLHGNERLEEETSKIFNLFLNNCGEPGPLNPLKIQGVHKTDIPRAGEMLQLNIFLYDIDFVDGELIGELARRSIQKFEKSVKLLRYNNHNCYVSDMNSFFKSFRCSTCDTIFSKAGNLERRLITCNERVKHIYLKNVYQLRETLFEKLDSFNIPYREDQKVLISNLFALRKRRIKKLKLQSGLENMSLYQFQFRQTSYPKPFFFAIQILDTLYLLLSESLKAWQRKAEHK